MKFKQTNTSFRHLLLVTGLALVIIPIFYIIFDSVFFDDVAYRPDEVSMKILFLLFNLMPSIGIFLCFIYITKYTQQRNNIIISRLFKYINLLLISTSIFAILFYLFSFVTVPADGFVKSMHENNPLNELIYFIQNSAQLLFIFNLIYIIFPIKKDLSPKIRLFLSTSPSYDLLI